jgi:tetratricopeptide (TPR) repeat protein
MTRRPRFRLSPPPWADGLLVLWLTVVSFLPLLFGGFLDWDDDQNFLENPGYRGLDLAHLRWMLTTYHMGHWKPLTWLTHGVDWAIWGMHPMGYKALGLGIHAAAAVTFLWAARRLLALGFARPLDGPLRAGALGGALLFALHPLRVEPVAWLSARGDLIAGLGAFLTVLVYLRAQSSARRRAAWLALSVVLFAIALAGKSMVMTLPVVLLVLDVYPLRRLGSEKGWLGPAARRVYLEKLPYLALSALTGIVAVRARIEFGSLIEVNEVGWPARLAATGFSLAFHLWKTVVPLDLSPLYDLRVALGRGPAPFVAAWLIVLALTLLAAARAHRWPAFAAAWACHVIMLLPVSGLAQNGPQIAADRYTYLAGAGWALLAGAGLAWCAAQVATQSPRRTFARCVLGLATAGAVSLVSLSAWQALAWHDSITLWSRAVVVEPGGALAHTGLATALLGEGHRAEAAAHYRRAIAIFPKLPEAEMGLALIASGEGRTEEAIRYGRQALARQPRRAGFRLVMAEILWHAERRDEAIEALREARALDPAAPLFAYMLALQLSQIGRSAEALAVLEAGHLLRRAANLPEAEGERFTALVYEPIDRAQAVAAWQRYILALSRIPRPTAREVSQLGVGLAALDELNRRPAAPPTPR